MSRDRLKISAAAPGGLLLLVPTIAAAQEFTPAEITVPANKRVQVTVVNASTPEEFESSALKVEQLVPGKSKAVVRTGALKPGRYFMKIRPKAP